jgi:CSLREA domain-containing protein/uncharacterized delta-60 repeat protein
MKYIKEGLALFFIVILTSLPSQAHEWSYTYGGTHGDVSGNQIQQTTDEGYILTGSTSSFGAGAFDYWILKLNADGSIVWQKTYGGSVGEGANDIQQTADGGYIVAGYTYSFGAGEQDCWILKLNADGTIVWQKTYGGSGNDGARDIQQTADGGYIVVGKTTSFGAGSNDLWILKLNADGTIVWQKTYGGSGGEDARDIQQTADGGYIVVGGTLSFGAGSSDCWILKLNADGTIAWQKTYGGSSGDNLDSIQQTSDDGYIAAGTTLSFGEGEQDCWILKLNADGSVAWQKTYGGSGGENVRDIQQTADGGYIVAAYSYSFGAGGRDYWIVKLNADGSVAWQKTYGGSGDDYVDSIQQISDLSYIVSGYTTSFGGSDSGDNRDLWVLKLNDEGEIPNCDAMGSSEAVINNTSAVVGNTSVNPINTFASPLVTTVVPQNTSAERSLICRSWRSITVNSLNDPGDGICDVSECTLREAIDDANPGNQILFDVTGTIPLDGSSLVIDKDLTITGPWPENLSISGNYLSRVLYIEANVEVEISDVTITQGDDNQGSGIFNRGDLILRNCEISGCGTSNSGDGVGIYNDGLGRLYIDSCLITNNFTEYSYGAGIYNAGEITITSSQISDNFVGEVEEGGVGIYNAFGGNMEVHLTNITDNLCGAWCSGGGIYNAGDVIITSSDISFNDVSIYEGGGIYNSGTMTIEDSTIRNNRSCDWWGGGIYNSGQLILTESIIEGNIADSIEVGLGGGIGNRGEMTIINSTIRNNEADGWYDGFGGGVSNSGDLTIIYSTIYNNTAHTEGGGVFNEGRLALKGTWFSGNIPDDCVGCAENNSESAHANSPGKKDPMTKKQRKFFKANKQ